MDPGWAIIIMAWSSDSTLKVKNVLIECNYARRRQNVRDILLNIYIFIFFLSEPTQ